MRIGHDKTNLEQSAKIHYRRWLDRPLEEVNVKYQEVNIQEINHLNDFVIFKSDFSSEEKIIIDKLKIEQEIKNLLKDPKEIYFFDSPFKKEYILRGKSNLERKKSFIFDSMKDPMKYLFIHKDNNIKPVDFDIIYKNDNSQLDNKRELEKNKKKLSKGEFLYLARVYNSDLFEKNVKILEKINLMMKERKKIKS